MRLTKLRLVPDDSSYSVQDSEEVVSTRLDGGASRYRKDLVDSTSKVSVVWICDNSQYKYLRAFFRSLLSKGAKPFLIDLIIDQAELTEHKAYFIPESIALTEQKGLTYVVSAQLEVEPAEIDTEAETMFAALFSEFGSTWQTDFPPIESEFDWLINTKLPADT